MCAAYGSALVGTSSEPKTTYPGRGAHPPPGTSRGAHTTPARGRAQTIAEMLYAHPNLYISITPFHLACTNVMDEECWVALCEKFPTRFMVGTSVRGRGGNEYMQDWLQLIRFLAKVRTTLGATRF